jgi:hypothetical protein
MFIFVLLFLLIGCAGSVGIFSGEPGHVYSACASLRCVGCRAGTIIFGYAVVWAAGPFGFFSLWPGSGGYGTVELVRERWSVSLFLSSVFCPFFWRLGVIGRKFSC